MERIVVQRHFPKVSIPKLKRVAAYARVSCGKDTMLHSLSAQVSYYSDLIQNHSGWQYVGVYADEALTGTRDNRANFQRLLADCCDGMIDMVITKSISRFARNTVTLLEAVRELKNMGVDVYFEEQNIHSLSADGELMLTILASYAQEESLSVSENQKWRVRHNFENGMPWNGTVLGYRYNQGTFEIDPEEAEIVRFIFDTYSKGIGATTIAKKLNARNIPTRYGNQWHDTGVMGVLRNYTYTGNLLLQTTYSENHLSKRMVPNNGELPQYHITNSHEPIIDLEQFNAVQELISQRSEKHCPGGQKKKVYPFAGKLQCSTCGKNYRRKTVRGKAIWICPTFNTRGRAFCASKQIPEDTLYQVSTEVLGMDQFDADAFLSKITAIRVEKNNILVFCFSDGTQSVKRWQDRSRRQSWTAEMRKSLDRMNRRGGRIMKNAKNITVIPATINPLTRLPKAAVQQRRVAGYARVSTDSEEQLTSYEAQVDYYSRYIRSRSDWLFVDVYTDEGISATNTKRREGFNRMVADTLDGKIDLIVTKSVSRFARNTVDSLTTVRKLKDAGVEVYFEKENIWTLDSKGELLITIISSLAQEESRSISENVTWGQRKRFADGKVSIPYGHFLGYRKGADGLPEVVPDEAEIVRSIYQMFVEGTTTNAIAKRLTDKGIPTPAGKQNWQRATVESILRNEKYKGSALLQKSFTVDFLQKKMKVNEGEVPQYYVEHSHEAIIPPEEWERVQLELARRKNSPRRTRCNSPFAGKLICGDCGEIFGSKVWHSTSKYRRTIWQCNAKFKGEEKCRTPHLYEDDLKQHFITALSTLISDRDALLDDLRTIRAQWLDFQDIEQECEDLLQEMDVVSGMIKAVVNENASMEMSQTAYTDRYNALVDRFEKSQSRYDELQNLKERRQMQADEISGCLFALYELDTLELKFNDVLWNTVIRHVTVYNDEHLVFHFKTGHEISVKI